MKAIFFFVLGVFAGAYAVHVYDAREWETGRAHGTFGDTIESKRQEWHLTSADISSDLDKTGQVFREKAAVAGGKISDVRIAAVIKAKFVLDRDLSARDISVDVADGAVTLSGTAPSTESIGRAAALALDTDGVRNVTSRLSVQSRE
jgi:osmotically-inducible protein OsmY